MATALQAKQPGVHSSQKINHEQVHLSYAHGIKAPMLKLSCGFRRNTRIHAANGDEQIMTPEEEAFYSAHLAKKREERQKALAEASAKSKMMIERKRAAEKAAEQQQAADAPDSTRTGSEPAPPPMLARPARPGAPLPPSKLPTPSLKPSPSQPLAKAISQAPVLPPAADKRPMNEESKAQTPVVQDSQVINPPGGSKGLSRASGKPIARGGLPKGRNSMLNMRRSSNSSRRQPAVIQQPEFDEADDDDDSDDDNDLDIADLEAFASQLLSGMEGDPSKGKNVVIDAQLDVPAATDASGLPPASKSPSQEASSFIKPDPAQAQKQSASKQPPVQSAKATRRQALSQDELLLQQLQALIDADSDSDDDEESNRMELINMDDIDWQALQAYEDFEKETDKPPQPPPPRKQQQQINRPTRPGTTSISTNTTTSSSTKPSTPSNNSGTTTGRSSTANKPASSKRGSEGNDAGPSGPVSAVAGTTAIGAAAAAAGLATLPQKEALPAVTADEDKVEVLGLDDLLQELNSWQAGDWDASALSGESAAALPDQDGSQTQMRQDLLELEKLYLGEGWQQQLAGMTSEGAMSADEDGEEAPAHADEVTTMLLSLVNMSAKNYIDTELFPEKLEEEERANLVWTAPWALIVMDDSKESLLEYANKQALDLLGIQDFIDIYDTSVFSLLPQDIQKQQDWLFALSEIEDRDEDCTTLQNVQMVRKGADGKPNKLWTAKEVQIFRVDNLDEGRVGSAMLIKEWQE